MLTAMRRASSRVKMLIDDQGGGDHRFEAEAAPGLALRSAP
jgi:hypothetical protein